MTKEELPNPRSPLPKIAPANLTGGMSPRQLEDLYQETVLLRQDLNKVLTYLKSLES